MTIRTTCDRCGDTANTPLLPPDWRHVSVEHAGGGGVIHTNQDLCPNCAKVYAQWLKNAAAATSEA